MGATILRQKISRAADKFGMYRRRRRSLRLIRRDMAAGGDGTVRAIEPIWPLPRRSQMHEDQIRAEFDRFPLWHYRFAFEGGLTLDASYIDPAYDPKRPLKRFRHFMPWLLDACGGTLAGKRVLDIGCNAGFWSIQCALFGAREVVGIDARDDLIAQANLVKAITGIDNVRFRKLDFWDLSPELLGGQFDVVLNFGILYHLPKPVEALDLTRTMAREFILLDTAIDPSRRPVVSLRWEEPRGVRSAAEAGMVAYPSAPAVELMLRHLRFRRWNEIALRTADMPYDYLAGCRSAWLIHV